MTGELTGEMTGEMTGGAMIAEMVRPGLSAWRVSRVATGSGNGTTVRVPERRPPSSGLIRLGPWFSQGEIVIDRFHDVSSQVTLIEYRLDCKEEQLTKHLCRQWFWPSASFSHACSFLRKINKSISERMRYKMP